MKTPHLIVGFLLVLLLEASASFAQQTGLAWFNSIASAGIDNSPGFATDTSGHVFIAVNFSSPLVLESGGNSDTLDPGLYGEAIVAQINTENGELTHYFHLSSPGHLAATGIGFYLNRLVVSGSCHDSVFLNSSGNGATYLGGGSGIHTGFQLFCGPGGEEPRFTQPASAALRAGFERICIADSLLVTAGKYLPDSIEARRVMITKGDGSNRPIFLPETTSTMEINDMTFAFDHLFVSGSFRDSLSLNNGKLYSLAGRDAFVAIADSIDSTYLNVPLAFHGLQDARAVAMAFYDSSLWVAVNFNDTLHLPLDVQLNGRGGSEAALLRYNSLLQLQESYHLKGNRSEKIERLFVSDNKLYVLGNIASDSCELIHNGNNILQLGHTYGTGAHTLLSIDTAGSTNLVWMAKEGRLGRLIGVHKVSPTETLLAGLYGNTISIDSVPYNPFGIQDVYILRIDDLCLSRLKTTREAFKFCEGDSLLVKYALPSFGNVLMPTAKAGDQFYISKPGVYRIPYESECGCIEADTLVFDWYKPIQGENPLKMIMNTNQFFALADGGAIELSYVGHCEKLFDPLQPQYQLQPNPAMTNASLIAFIKETGTLTFELIDTHGAVLLSEQKVLSDGQHFIPLAVHHLQPGNYYLRLHFDTGLKMSSSVLKLSKL